MSTKKTPNQQTAQQAYEARMKEINGRLDEIQKLLADHLPKGKRADWAYTGDLGYVAEQLHIVEAFLKNEDV